jgi:transcriptional regulator with XRE-family HTH domain
MTARSMGITPNRFTSFGELLRFLRRRAGLTQLELSIAVGYSSAQISRLEQNLRVPELTTLAARFVPALHIEDEPEWVERLLELASLAHQAELPAVPTAPPGEPPRGPLGKDAGPVGHAEESSLPQDMAPPTPQAPALPKPWHEIWWTALVRPSEETYAALAEDPHATTRRAYGWMVVSGLLSGVIFAASSGIPADQITSQGALVESDALFRVVVMVAGPYLIAPILWTLTALLWLAFTAWLVQRIAGGLGGTGTYSKLVFLLAAFRAPLEPLQALSTIQDCLFVLGLGVSLYSLVLTMIAVKAVNRLSWERAWVASSPVLAIVLGSAALKLLLATMGVFNGTF